MNFTVLQQRLFLKPNGEYYSMLAVGGKRQKTPLNRQLANDCSFGVHGLFVRNLNVSKFIGEAKNFYPRRRFNLIGKFFMEAVQKFPSDRYLKVLSLDITEKYFLLDKAIGIDSIR